MINWEPPQVSSQEVAHTADSSIPENLRTYEFLLSGDRITPEIIEAMKKGYAKAWERLCKNSEYIAKFKGAEYDRHWILWQIDCCEPCNYYMRLFKLFRNKGIMKFTDDELYKCFGLYEYVPPKGAMA